MNKEALIERIKRLKKEYELLTIACYKHQGKIEELEEQLHATKQEESKPKTKDQTRRKKTS